MIVLIGMVRLIQVQVHILGLVQIVLDVIAPVTLNLTINNSSTSSSIITSCDSFDWNGQTYTSSGSYTWTGTNSVGCDSIIHYI